VDQYISLDDGYYLIGHTEWMDDRITSVNTGGWAFKAFDSSGRELPIEPAIFDSDHLDENLEPNQWAYRLYGKGFSGPLTLRATQMGVEFAQPVRFTLDLRSSNFDFSYAHLGKIWELNQPLDIPDISANVTKANYVKVGDLHGFEFIIQADAPLQGLGFIYESGLITDGMFAVAGGGGSYRDASVGMVFSAVLTNAPIQFPLVLSATGMAINGIWETSWVPPVDTTGISVYVEQACLDLPRWKQISSLDYDSPPEKLENMLTYVDMYLPDDASVTSPDGQWIAFVDKVKGRMGYGLYFSRADGSERQLLVQLDYWMVLSNLSWSLDSEWIGFGILNTDLYYPADIPYAAVNIHSCDVVPLTGQ
jgi:hypothetical protein